MKVINIITNGRKALIIFQESESGASVSRERKATKLIQSLRNLSYEERLKSLGFFLRRRRLRGGMIEMFKMFHGLTR